VLRLYECEGVPAKCTIAFPKNVSALYKTNFLEEIQADLPLKGNQAELQLRPFEICTLLVRQ